MSEVLDGEKIVENIEKYGEANPKELETPKEEAPYLTFKTNDDFYKHQIEYKADSKPVKEDLSTILKRAQQGYNYAQHMEKLKSERAGFETERKTYQQQIDEAKIAQEKWSKFEQYSKENPTWYDHWSKAWDDRGNFRSDGQDQNTLTNDLDQRVNALLQDRLKPYEELLNHQQMAAKQQELSKHDSVLDEQVKSIRKNYSNIDFDATDPETGKNLEYQVLEFMQENGMTNFNHAFKAYYHDNLVKMSIEKQKETEQKLAQDRKKQGIIDIKSAPSNKKSIDTKGLSWDQITKLAEKELGLGN